MNINIITQARINSTRFPGKVLKSLGNSTVLSTHLARLRKSVLTSEIIVATTKELDAEKIVSIALKNSCKYYQGSTDDVLDRFYNASLENPSDIIIRVTSDCPLNDGLLIDEMIRKFMVIKDIDYMSNCNPPTFADGLDIEIFTFKALQRAWIEAKLLSEREHVTSYIWKNSNDFKISNFSNSNANDSSFRLTIDTHEDLKLIEKLVADLGTACEWTEYVSHLKKHPQLQEINSHHFRNEGYSKSLKKDF